MTELFEQKVKNMCFGAPIEGKILASITQNMSVDEFQSEVRKYDECFNGCCQCGCDLEYGEDGFLTSHGTCNVCVCTEV